jgi:hypothetical protein
MIIYMLFYDLSIYNWMEITVFSTLSQETYPEAHTLLSIFSFFAVNV